MPRQRIMRTSGVQSGGFTGGSYVRPQAAQGGSLTQLADALGSLSGGMGQYAYGLKQKNDAEAKLAAKQALDAEKAQDALLKEEGQKLADAAKMKLAAMNGSERAAFIGETEFAAKLADNPYAYAAVMKYEGSRSAQEAWEGMAEQGIDVTDDEAVGAYLEQVIEGKSDPHFASGFNQEWSRSQAQITQQTVARAAAEYENRVVESAVGNFMTSLEDGMGPEKALATLKSMEAYSDLTGKQLTSIQMTALESLSRSGNVELAEALASASRGDAPPLAKSKEAGRVAMLLNTARATRDKARTERLMKELPEIGAMIAQGLTVEQLKSHPTYEVLSPEQQNSLQNQIRARDRREREKAERAALNANIQAAEQEFKTTAAVAVLNGDSDMLPELSKSFVDGNGNDRKVSVTASQVKRSVVNMMRDFVFSEGVANTEPAAALTALSNAGNAGVKVPGFVTAAFDDVARNFHPDHLKGLEDLPDEEAENLLGILVGADPALRKDIIGEGSAVWNTAVALSSTRPGMSANELIRYAAEIKSNPITKKNIDGFNRTVRNFNQQYTPKNLAGKGRASFSAGQFGEFLDRPEVQAELMHTLTGLQPDEVDAAVEDFVEARFVPVRGSLVELPEVAGETYMDRETTAKALDTWITTQAKAIEESGGDSTKRLLKPGNVQVSKLPGVQRDAYVLTFVDQDESFQLRAAGFQALYGANRINQQLVAEQEEIEAENRAAAKAANKGRNLSKRRQKDQELSEILTD